MVFPNERETSISKTSKISNSYIIHNNEFISDIERIKDTKSRSDFEDQARKSVGRMTWHQEPKKDVTSCDKLRLGANIHRPADVRMGKPGRLGTYHHTVNP